MISNILGPGVLDWIRRRKMLCDSLDLAVLPDCRCSVTRSSHSCHHFIPTIGSCLSWVFHKTRWLNNMGGKGLFGLYLHIKFHHQWKSEVRTGNERGRVPGGQLQCRGRGAVLLTGLLIMACLSCFLIVPRSTCPGAPPSVCWTPHHQCPTGLPIARSYEGIFSLEAPAPLMILVCVKLT